MNQEAKNASISLIQEGNSRQSHMLTIDDSMSKHRGNISIKKLESFERIN